MAVCRPGSGLFYGTMGALMFFVHTHALLANSNFWKYGAVVSVVSGTVWFTAMKHMRIFSFYVT